MIVSTNLSRTAQVFRNCMVKFCGILIYRGEKTWPWEANVLFRSVILGDQIKQDSREIQYTSEVTIVIGPILFRS